MDSTHPTPNNEQESAEVTARAIDDLLNGTPTSTEGLTPTDRHTIDILRMMNPDAHMPSQEFIKRTRVIAKEMRSNTRPSLRFRISLISALGIGAAFCAWGVVGVFHPQSDTSSSSQTVAVAHTNTASNTQTTNSESTTNDSTHTSTQTNVNASGSTTTDTNDPQTNTNASSTTNVTVALQADISDLDSLVASLDSSLDDISALTDDTSSLDSSSSLNDSVTDLSNQLSSL